MQRLKNLFKRQPRNDDRGASAVVVALMMVPIMILAALAIDIGAMHADRQQLQTGADAGALAIAQDCAREDCGTTGATAQSMAAANLNASGAIGEITDLNPSTGEVSVQTSTLREHWFAPIIGINSSPIQAQSSARWGYPTGGTAVMPLAFSACELEVQTGISVVRDPETQQVVRLDISESTPDIVVESLRTSKTCSRSSRDYNHLPGGFGWLDIGQEQCGRSASAIGGWVDSDPGRGVPSGCRDELLNWMGQTVLLPIFDETIGSGSGGQYLIVGYAAFTLSGYSFPGERYPSRFCGGNVDCIRGSFDRFVDLSDDFDYSPNGPRLGAAVVALTE